MTISEKEAAEATTGLQLEQIVRLEEKYRALEQAKESIEKLLSEKTREIEQCKEKAEVDQTVIFSLKDDIASLKSNLDKSSSALKLEQDKVATIQTSLDTTLSNLRAAEVRDYLYYQSAWLLI